MGTREKRHPEVKINQKLVSKASISKGKLNYSD